jgi:hypothetical protein
MLRRLQNITGKNIDAQLPAGAAMVKGMIVQKDLANGKAILPTTQVGLYFVDVDVQPTGLMSYEGDISDYDDRLNKIAKDSFVQLEKGISGERFATDQFIATGLTVGDYMGAHTTVDENQGKLEKLASGTSNLIYGGYVIDNGHRLAIVQII